MTLTERPAWRFIVHFLQMALAMLAGMLLLEPVWAWALPAAVRRADVHVLAMATDMAIGMAVWMRVRRHSWASTLEMCAAMYAPFAVLLVPYWLGAVSAGVLMMGGHILMVPAMILAMLRRRPEYTHAHSSGSGRAVRTLLGVAALVAAFAAPPAAIGGLRAMSYLDGVYAPPAVTDVPPALRDARPAYDPAKPTAVVLLSNAGANAGDTLPPYETLAATGALNLYTVAPQRRLVTLTGGLDLVPDLDFAGLAQLLAGRAPDLVVVPAVPDATGDTSATLRAWLAGTARAGAVVLSVCEGAKVVAEAGVMDGHTATSHWLRVSGLAERHPQVQWVRQVRYVDDGAVISTGGVLSGIDGALRYIERTLGGAAATKAAAEVGWPAYSAGTPAPLPKWSFGAREMISGVNLGFRPHADLGVVLDDGIGETELAAVFIAYSDVSYIARTHTLGRASAAAIRSRHGLTFVPRGSATDRAGYDRVLIPGAAAARTRDPEFDARVRAASGVPPEYLQAAPGFAFDAVLRDMARTVDVPTAQWRAKTLEYPAGRLELTGPGWPWPATALPLLYGLVGLSVALGVRWAWRSRRRTGPARQTGSTGSPAATQSSMPAGYSRTSV